MLSVCNREAFCCCWVYCWASPRSFVSWLPDRRPHFFRINPPKCSVTKSGYFGSTICGVTHTYPYKYTTMVSDLFCSVFLFLCGVFVKHSRRTGLAVWRPHYMLYIHAVSVYLSFCRAPETPPTDAPCLPLRISPMKMISARNLAPCLRHQGTRCPGTCRNMRDPSGKFKAAPCWTQPREQCLG